MTQTAKAADAIRNAMDRAGGELDFASFVHEALYAPGLGYYTGGSAKLGANGDFVTAPEISELFGHCIARQIAPVIESTGGCVLEFGAGRGTLAVALLQRLETLGVLPREYLVLEVSPDLAERQRALIESQLPQLAGRVRWIDEPPSSFDGVMLANEVLDAIPFSRFVKRSGAVKELTVGYNPSGFHYRERNPSGSLRAAVAAIEADLGQALPDGYTSEVCLAAQTWTADLVQRLQQGLLLLFDYGVDRRSYYAADRSEGWLRCHFRHYAHNDALLYPGIQDITTWIDFSAIAETAVTAGASVAGYVTQAHFLMAAGLDEELAELADQPLERQMHVAAGVRTLTLPGEMGEHIKAIGLSKGEIPIPDALTLMDRTPAL
ncbi:MAG: SAM-dependent methyltransferase [Pseudomonadota bacterium]